MNSSDNTLQTLVLIPIAAALVGVMLILGLSLLPNPTTGYVAVPTLKNESVAIPSGKEITRSGDGMHSFHVTRPEGEFESFSL